MRSAQLFASERPAIAISNLNVAGKVHSLIASDNLFWLIPMCCMSSPMCQDSCRVEQKANKII